VRVAQRRDELELSVKQSCVHPGVEGWDMASSASLVRGWIGGVCCALAALLSGYRLFLDGRVNGTAGAQDGIWLDVVFLLAIFLGTVILVRHLAGRAIVMMDRDG